MKQYLLKEEMFQQSDGWMLRNDGKPFAVRIHPDISVPYSAIDAQDVKWGTLDDRSLQSVIWLYNHTLNNASKTSALIYTDGFLKDHGFTCMHDVEASSISPDIKKFILDHKGVFTFETSFFEAQDMAEVLREDIYQNFCRIRFEKTDTGHRLGNRNAAIFRVSSAQFNWLPVIWKFFETPKGRTINNFSVCYDEEYTGKTKFLRDNFGNVYNGLTSDDPMTLTKFAKIIDFGPVLKEKNYINLSMSPVPDELRLDEIRFIKMLYSGASVSDLLEFTQRSPAAVCASMQKLRLKEAAMYI